MKTVPFMSQPAWDLVKKSGDLHPGLTFYRFFEMQRNGNGKNEPTLRCMAKKTSIPFAPKLKERIREQLNALEATGIWKKKLFEAKLSTRLAVGLGIPSQSENGIFLDHTHGIPLIPGSALKGTTQDYALLDQGYSKDDPHFVAIFGAQPPDSNPHFVARKGHVVFFDAVPADTGNPFDIDIMNPHYGEYYAQQGNTPPADYLKPNPILFLTVKAGIRFQFALAARKACFRMKKPDGSEPVYDIPAQDLLDKATAFLEGALEHLGVGGKTRVGYGLFKGGD